MNLPHQIEFLKRFLDDPQGVGALGPSSRQLAKIVCRPFVHRTAPARVLEVGAGTGAFTVHLLSHVAPGDHLDVCELHDEFADILERDVLGRPAFSRIVAEGRVRVIRGPVQAIKADGQYDFIVSGLPLNSFELADVQDVFSVVRRALKPGGVFSYFEYLVLRRLMTTFYLGRARRRIRAVSHFLEQQLRDYRFGHCDALFNLPPARSHYLRFSKAETPSLPHA